MNTSIVRFAFIWGKVADCCRIYLGLLATGLVVTAAALATLSFAENRNVWLGLALLQGVGVSAAVTVGNLFIVEGYPQTEWNERISWLQTFNCGGQVTGMLLAAVMSQIDLDCCIMIAAGLTALAIVPGVLTPKAPGRIAGSRIISQQPSVSGGSKYCIPQLFPKHLNLTIFKRLN